jgi:hypothetical protein
MSCEEPILSFSVSSSVSLRMFSCHKVMIWPACCLPTSSVWTRNFRKKPKSLLRRSWYWGAEVYVQVCLEPAPFDSAFSLGPFCRISERF